MWCYCQGNILEQVLTGTPWKFCKLIWGIPTCQKKVRSSVNIKFGWHQNGWNLCIIICYRTNWHVNVGNEYDLVMNSAGIIDLTPFAKYIVEGSQAGAILDYITANK